MSYNETWQEALDQFEGEVECDAMLIREHIESQQAKIDSLELLVGVIDCLFISGNSTPLDRITITKERWKALKGTK